MSTKNTTTRRSFLKRGAMLAVPLATAAPAAILADDGLKTRLARLENSAAIRELHQNWLRRINTGATDAAALFADPNGTALDESVRGIKADHTGQPDEIEVAKDGKRATGRFHCAVEIETAIPEDCTLAQMAHEQGSGSVRRTERRMLNVDYVKTSGAWTISKIEFAPA